MTLKKDSLCGALFLLVRKKKTHSLCSYLCVPWDLASFHIQKEQPKSTCPRLIYRHHLNTIFNPITKLLEVVQHQGQTSCANCHSALCHVSVFVTIYQLLRHKNYAMTAE